MEIQILSTREQDLDIVFRLYDEAIRYQKEIGNNHWLGFSREMITGDVKNGFTYRSNTGITYTPDLPVHYENGTFAPLEMTV